MNDNHDPIHRIEDMIKKLQDKAGSLTQPVLSRYPLLFAFLLIFSAAAITHGFDLFADKIALFDEHPVALMAAGMITLVLTGTLYKVLKKLG